MKNICKTSAAIIILIQIISCTERIDIGLDESAVRLVVEGSVTADTMAHRVILTKTTGYYYAEAAPLVSGASVSITTGENTILLSEKSPGVYETDPTFFGTEGQAYTLNITLATPVGGYSEYSATDVMGKFVALDSVDLVFRSGWSDEGFYEVQCSFQDPATAEYYRFLVSANGKMLTDTLDEWFISDDRFFNGDYVETAGVAFLDQASDEEKLAPGDEITVEMNSLSREYAGFIAGAQAESWGSIPLFSGPPANVKGNISNGAIGFFAAYTTSRAKIRAGEKKSEVPARAHTLTLLL